MNYKNCIIIKGKIIKNITIIIVIIIKISRINKDINKI